MLSKFQALLTSGQFELLTHGNTFTEEGDRLTIHTTQWIGFAIARLAKVYLDTAQQIGVTLYLQAGDKKAVKLAPLSDSRILAIVAPEGHAIAR
jgi:hypothetical protein